MFNGNTLTIAQIGDLPLTDAPADRPTRPLTLRDVSEASGVSEMTVSRVLRNRGDVSQATREKVLEAARTLGYVPNKIAGALASQRVNLVAVVIPSMSNMVFPEVMTGISQVLENTPLQPVVGVTHYKPEQEERVLYEMLSWRPSGVIVAGLEHSDAARAMLIAAGVPIVEIMDTDGECIDSVVGVSHRHAGAEMGRQIAKWGYEQIAFLGSKLPLDRRARKRFEGLTNELAKHGLEVIDQEFYEGGSSLKSGREMTKAILDRQPEVDFMYYSNDMIAAGGLMYLQDAGIKVPEQIGLAGFNNIELLDGFSTRIATMDACRREIGIKAAEIIAECWENGESHAGKRVELSPRLQMGDTLKR